MGGGPYLAVFVGGALGSLARWGIALLLTPPVPAFPWQTFAVNVTGAFGLAALGAVAVTGVLRAGYLRPLVGAGFFGAYTTFSIMAFEGVRLIEVGRTGTALAYWILTLVVGCTAGVLGVWTGRLWARRGGTVG